MDVRAETRVPDAAECHGVNPRGSDGVEKDFEARLRDETLAALAEFAAGAGHEINNPLATILICAQRLQASLSDPEQRRLVATIGGQALRVRDMIGDVMLFARPPAPRLEPVDLSTVMADVLDRFRGSLAEQRIATTIDTPAGVSVMADPTQLRVVVSELLRNSIHAQPDGGRITIACRLPVSPESDLAVLSVTDSGTGLDEVSRRRLFDPFYSGRQAGRGLGFGLCKVWRIVTNHGGRIDVAEPAGGGLAVTIHWPTKAVPSAAP